MSNSITNIIISHPVSLGVKLHLGPQDQIFVTVKPLRICGVPSLTRGRVCHLLLSKSVAHVLYICSPNIKVHFIPHRKRYVSATWISLSLLFIVRTIRNRKIHSVSRVQSFLRELRFPLPIYSPSASPQSSSLSPEAGTIGQEWPQCQ
jgi:hypothetical protein